MLKFAQIVEIRRLYYKEHLSPSEIASRTRNDYKTVLKYIDMTDFNTPPQFKGDEKLCPKLDPFKKTIEKWLEGDLNAPRKQRHSAIRIYERLKSEFADFNCSYRSVCSYVKAAREKLDLRNDEIFLPLVHYPGECQGDFGEAEFIENGVRKTGKYFVLDFPYSNCAFAQLKYGENTECLLEAMDALFRYIGGVPKTIWLDNASSMVKEIICAGGRKITERFERFVQHYGFTPIFMNPRSGNEKGGAESKVGYVRRHFLVPIPEFDDINKFNNEFLQLQENDSHRYHYRKNRLISDLFLEDMAELLELPKTDFDLADYRLVKTDQNAMFTIDSRYTYSCHPDYRKKRVIVKLTSDKVMVLNEEKELIVTHQRLYGSDRQVSIDWIPYLRAISYKPRSFFNTGLQEYLDEEVRAFLLSCSNDERGRILSIMADISERKGFDETKSFIYYAKSINALDPDGLELLYRRMYSSIPYFPKENPKGMIIETVKMDNDLSEYDRLLKGGKTDGHE